MRDYGETGFAEEKSASFVFVLNSIDYFILSGSRLCSANDIKIRCLTTWLRPNSQRLADTIGRFVSMPPTKLAATLSFRGSFAKAAKLRVIASPDPMVDDLPATGARAHR